MADISQTIHNPVGIPVKGVKTLTASATLTREDAGKIIVFDSTTTIVATLPKTRKGYTYHFVVNQLTTTAGHAVRPASDDSITFKGGSTATDGTAAQCDAATDAIGDHLVVVGDGNNGYYAISVGGTWSRIA